MANDSEKFIGLSVWHAATLYVGFYKDGIPTNGLVKHIKKKSEYSSTYHFKWRLLYKAIKNQNLDRVLRYALEPRELGVPWPDHWRKIGQKYESKMGFVYS